ncbi:MAG: serine protease [Desmonostoc vinosum HA7617-LM4]|jgi:S1-C subfamily serine protease|nr:serine protease [Desmonostoc vinosum HA7617-LM4]
MDWHNLTLVVCISSISLTLSASAPVVSISDPCNNRDCISPQSEKLYQQAQSITVKVMSKEFLGSGILLRKQGSVYTVLTNAHVLQAGEPPYRIQVSNGRIYTAKLARSLNLGKNDLALLQFKSADIVYTVATIGSKAAVGQEVFVAGFPASEEGSEGKDFTFTPGKVSLVLPKPLEGGYQLGYTNAIANGMSGGPLLNRRGQVVGINGMQADPLWDVPSVFADGSKVDERLHKIIVRLSWAVPMDRVVQMMQKPVRAKDSSVLNKAD